MCVCARRQVAVGGSRYSAVVIITYFPNGIVDGPVGMVRSFQANQIVMFCCMYGACAAFVCNICMCLELNPKNLLKKTSLVLNFN